MKLELGSGYHPTPGFTHLDANPNAPDVDIVGQCFPLALPDGSCDELRAVDVLEHLPMRQTQAALNEWGRVLRPGGKLFVQVPDADTACWWYCNHPERLVERIPPDLPQTPISGLAWRLLGGQDDDVQAKDGDDWRLNAHYSLWTRESLADALFEAGFKVPMIERNEHPNLSAYCYKQEER